MFLALSARQAGISAPQVTTQHVSLHQLRHLELSLHKYLVPHRPTVISCLDVDIIEGRYLLCGDPKANISIYDVSDPVNANYENKVTINPLHKHIKGHKYCISSVQWYPFDTGLFISSSNDGLVKVWDANMLTVAQEFDLQGRVLCSTLSSCATSHSLIAASSAPSTVQLLDMRSGGTALTLLGHSGETPSLAWNPTHPFSLVSGSSDQTVRLWDLRRPGALSIMDQHNNSTAAVNRKYISHRDQKNIAAVQSHNARVTQVAFSVDGNYLLTQGDDKRLRLWDVLTGLNTLVNYGPIDASASQPFTLSGCGAFVFSGQTNNIAMYEVMTGRLVKWLRGHFGPVRSLCFNNHLQELYSGASDSALLVWQPIRGAQQRDTVADHSATGAGNNDDAIFQPPLPPDRREDEDNWSSSEEEEEGGGGGGGGGGRPRQRARLV